MKIVHRKKSLPRRFDKLKGANRAVAIADVRVSKGARMRMKLLVFKSTADLRYFWVHGLGKGDLGRFCLGAVNGLNTEHTVFHKDGKETKWMEFDKNYFAVMGLVQSSLTMEVICHESVHAAYAYAVRAKVKWPNEKQNWEEAVCYPSGRIADMINRFLHDNNLYIKKGRK